jgi:hypothetical protein
MEKMLGSALPTHADSDTNRGSGKTHSLSFYNYAYMNKTIRLKKNKKKNSLMTYLRLSVICFGFRPFTFFATGFL